MDIMELGTIGELVGGVAVIASLIFVGLQVRQNTQSVRASTSLDATRMYADLHGTVLHTPDLGHIFVRGMEDFESLSEEEQSRFLWLQSYTLYIVEGLYRQYRLGFLEHESWLPFERLAAGVIRTQTGKRWWNAPMVMHSASFREHFDGVVASKRLDIWRYDPAGMGRA